MRINMLITINCYNTEMTSEASQKKTKQNKTNKKKPFSNFVHYKQPPPYKKEMVWRK